MIYSLVILFARVTFYFLILLISRLVKISIYIIIYSSNDNTTSLIYYTLQLRKIVLASRGRVACASSRDRSNSEAVDISLLRACVYTFDIYILHIYLSIYIYISFSPLLSVSFSFPLSLVRGILSRSSPSTCPKHSKGSSNWLSSPIEIAPPTSIVCFRDPKISSKVTTWISLDPLICFARTIDDRSPRTKTPRSTPVDERSM